MLRIYSPRRTKEIIRRLTPLIRQVSGEYRVPEAALKAVMYRETKEIDLFDLAVDAVVRVKPLGKIFRRWDSSTGYMQIFGFVGVNAVNFAEEQGITTAKALGLPGGRRLSAASREDVRTVWLRLNGDTEFNLRLAALNLLSCAREMNGSHDFASFSPEEMKRAFSRYNARTKQITGYGEEVYGYYLSEIWE